MVVRDLLPAGSIDRQGEGAVGIVRKALGYVDCKIVLLDAVEYADALAAGVGDGAGIAYLAAHLAVERCAVEHELQHFLVLLDYGAALKQEGAFEGGGVVSGELHILALVVHCPVAESVGGGVAGAVFLLLEFHLEAFVVNGEAALGGDEVGKVDGESVGVVQAESVGTGDELGSLVFCHAVVKQLDTAVQGAQEGHFFFSDDRLDELLLCGELGVSLTHIGYELGHQAAEERLVEAQEGIAVADCTAQDPADYVTCLDVGRELTVGDAERYGADMVGYDTHGNVGLGVLAVTVAAEGADSVKHAGEDVGIVVAVLALENGAEALEPHSGVDILGGKGLQMAVREALELHENQVPDFYHVRVGLVDEIASGDAAGGLLLGAADVDVDLGAGAAGARVPHFPEIVVLVAEDDVIFGEVLQPGVFGFLVHGSAILLGTLENSGIEDAFIDLVHLGEELPGPVDRLFLEVIAKAPVAQHLEHGVVIGVVADLLEVIMFSADSQALLRVGGAVVRCGLVAQEDVLELVHPGVGKHKGGVVLDHHRC